MTEQRNYIIEKFDKNGDYKGYEIDYVELVKYLKESDYIFYNDTPYHYDNGVYKSLTINEFCNSILPNNGTGKTVMEKQKIMERCFTTDLLAKSVDETGYIYFNNKRYKADDAFIVNCKNCLVLTNKENGKIITSKHDKRNVFFQQINTNWNTEAKQNEYDKKYLNNIHKNGKENVQLLFEMLGSSIGRTCDKSIFNILGKADSGKSTLIKVVQTLIGEDYVTNFNSKSINEDSKEIHEMLNAYVNIADDDDMNFSSNGIFLKRLSGGGATIPFQVKFRKEPVKGIFKTKLIFTSNEMISINFTTKDTEALLKRLIILPLDVAVSNEDKVKDIDKKLNYEYWLFRSITALSSLIRNNFKYTECANIEKFMIQDDFTEWFLNNVEATNDENDYVTTKDIYNDYKDYCQDNVCECMNERNFGTKLSKILNQKSSVKKIDGRSIRCYKGIKLHEESIFEK